MPVERLPRGRTAGRGPLGGCRPGRRRERSGRADACPAPSSRLRWYPAPDRRAASPRVGVDSAHRGAVTGGVEEGRSLSAEPAGISSAGRRVAAVQRGCRRPPRVIGGRTRADALAPLQAAWTDERAFVRPCAVPPPCRPGRRRSREHGSAAGVPASSPRPGAHTSPALRGCDRFPGRSPSGRRDAVGLGARGHRHHAGPAAATRRPRPLDAVFLWIPSSAAETLTLLVRSNDAKDDFFSEAPLHRHGRCNSPRARVLQRPLKTVDIRRRSAAGGAVGQSRGSCGRPPAEGRPPSDGRPELIGWRSDCSDSRPRASSSA